MSFKNKFHIAPAWTRELWRGMSVNRLPMPQQIKVNNLKTWWTNLRYLHKMWIFRFLFFYFCRCVYIDHKLLMVYFPSTQGSSAQKLTGSVQTGSVGAKHVETWEKHFSGAGGLSWVTGLHCPVYLCWGGFLQSTVEKSRSTKSE